MQPLRIALLALLAANICAAQTIDETTAELAKRLMRDPKVRELTTLSVRSASSLDAKQVALVESRLQFLTGKTAAPDADIRVTLSENARDYVWVAEIGRGKDRDVVIYETVRTRESSPQGGSLLTLDKELIWEQDQPMLDWALIDDRKGLLVMEPGKLVLYKRDGITWAPKATANLGASRSHDSRARIDVNQTDNGLVLFFDGGMCTGSIAPALKVDCGATETAWPMASFRAELTANRNYFSGRINISKTAKTVSPFYAAAAQGTLLLLAELDGRTRLYTANLEPLGVIGGWGSQITGVASSCGEQVLASTPGDITDSDAVRAYRIVDLGAVASSQPLGFPGAINELWSQNEAARAITVDRGRYAAWAVAVSCTN